MQPNSRTRLDRCSQVTSRQLVYLKLNMLYSVIVHCNNDPKLVHLLCVFHYSVKFTIFQNWIKFRLSLGSIFLITDCHCGPCTLDDGAIIAKEFQKKITSGLNKYTQKSIIFFSLYEPRNGSIFPLGKCDLFFFGRSLVLATLL